MPFVHIRIASETIAATQITDLQQEATRLMAAVMGKKANLTAVLIERAEPYRWSVAGEAVQVAGHLDVSITAGTNTPEEKAAFVAQAHTLLRDVLGPNLSVATYVVIHEIDADAWGYDGRTQQARRRFSDPTRAAGVV